VGKWFVIAAALCACSSSDPNGVYWDSTNRTLYLTDDKRDLILRRRAQAFEEVATLPPSSGLTGIARLADGRFIVTAFGFGTNGGVFVVDNGKPVPNLDAARRRSGIAKLDLAADETDVVSATDLIEPVGIVATAKRVITTAVKRPDLLAQLPDGALVTGTREGIVYAIVERAR
jgi:hypothetical protein